MEDLRGKIQKSEVKKRKIKALLIYFIWKNKWWMLLSLFIIIIAIFPIFSGKILGTWFHNFIGNLIKYGKL